MTWHYRFVINTSRDYYGDAPIELYEVYDMGEEGKYRTEDHKDPINFWACKGEDPELQVSKTLSNLQKSLEKYGIVTLEELDKELNMK